MDNVSCEDSFDSIPRPEYEAIGDGSIKSTSTPTLETNKGNKELCDNEEEIEKNIIDLKKIKLKKTNCLKLSAEYVKYESGDTDEDIVEEEPKDENVKIKLYEDTNLVDSNEEKTEGSSPNSVEEVVEKQIIPLEIVATEIATNIEEEKVKDVPSDSLVNSINNKTPKTKEKLVVSKRESTDEKTAVPQKNLNRSSTPLSREFVALQKSVNESKILSEFVTETSAVKERKVRKKPIILDETVLKVEEREKSGPTTNSTGESHVTADTLFSHMSTVFNGAERVRKSIAKIVPLKDENNSSDSIIARSRRRSRSKSLHRKSPTVLSISKLKKWPSDEKISKRTNMRSQNSEFVQKQMDFLNRVIHQQGDEAEASEVEYAESLMDTRDEEDLNNTEQIDSSLNESSASLVCNFGDLHQSSRMSTISDSSMGDGLTDADCLESVIKVIWQPPPKRGWDSFCWKCRHGSDLFPCSKCLRCFHSTCIKITATTKLDSSWICPECAAVDNVLLGPKRGRRSDLSLDLLSQLLLFALKRMKNVRGNSKFLFAHMVFPNLSKYFAHKVTFATLQDKIEKKVFRCAEEFVNETKWILHNVLLLTSGKTHNKETITAKAILKVCRQEANEIDTCPECYLNANTRPDWFVDVCTQPHLLLWAKLKGFPYWPAKAMGPGQGSYVNVRFFGEHDRAFVPVKDCFLYSEQEPNTQTGKRSARELADCIKEVEVHIKNIKAKIGNFEYAKYKTPYEPAEEIHQLECMMPGVMDYIARHQTVAHKPSLQYKIVKTADNNLSIIKKASTLETGNESDHSSTPSKKKSESNEADISKTKITSKYEVVNKATSEDSSSSKVSTVILKRKSYSGECRKSDDVELPQPQPKITKLNEKPDEEVRSNAKRKHGSDAFHKDSESDKHKSKHSKSEARVPVITIKTNLAKLPEAKDVSANTANNVTTVATLVKNKQGVTIKKISKENDKRAPSEIVVNKKADKIIKSGSGPAKEVAIKSNEMIQDKVEKDKSETNVSVILKDLVPFVIKKEISTDDEETEKAEKAEKGEKAEKAEKGEKALAKDATESSVNSGVEGNIGSPPKIGITEEAATAPPKATATVTATAISATPAPSPAPAPTPITVAVTSTQTSPFHPTTKFIPPAAVQEALLLTEIKEEVVSEDDDIQAMRAKGNISSKNLKTAYNANPQIEKVCVPVSNDTVRVVGDTTIQRVFPKTANTAQPLQDTAPAIASGATVSIVPSHTSALKRSTARGIPYGPLPASASPVAKPLNNSQSNASSNNSTNSNTTGDLSNLHSTQQQTRHSHIHSQRARKSFPNRAEHSPEISPARNNATVAQNILPSGLSSACVPTIISEAKRPLLRNSMVSIPVDVATSRNNNAVPVPPLTAVSKVTPSAASPITTAANIVTATITTTSTSPSASLTTSNGTAAQTPATISVPPPLAGLSQTAPTVSSASVSSLVVVSSSVQSENAVTNPTALPSTTNISSSALPAADAHLLGDFVTPTLASAITEVICRGPPRMTARPSGPLQSDGSSLFPSQAGPVCRTLVENAHKLTDFFISVMEDTMCEMSVGEEPVLQAKVTYLTMELERTKLTYEHEIAELKRTSDIMLCEMRKSMENEKSRIANEIRKQCEVERIRSVEETKKKQWCANCGREAQFYCCWNTSYCDYPCQQLHWSRHAASCAQTRQNNSEAMSSTATTSNGIAGASNSQQERPNSHGNKSNMNPTQVSVTHYNKAVNTTRKDKHPPKCATPAQNMMATQTAEVLKLPTNTYLRPVPNNNNHNHNHPMRNSAYTMPVQRFNIPLPITTSVNAGPPYTIVQRGSSWELMSTSPNNSPHPAIGASMTQSQQQQSRLLANSASVKNGARNRGVNSAVITQHNPNHVTSLQCANLRPSQM